MATEIERKWLVRSLPDLTGRVGVQVRQGYLTRDSDSVEVRLRSMGDCFFQTVKSRGGLVRQEVEWEISEQQFHILWPFVKDRTLEKLRYRIHFADREIELDVYQGGLGGLVVAEVEFVDAESAQLFSPPSWMGLEVTNDPRFRNSALAGKLASDLNHGDESFSATPASE